MSVLQIGPLRIALREQGPDLTRYDDWSYRSFFIPTTQAQPGERRTDLTVSVHAGARRIPASSPLFVNERHWAVWTVDHDLVFCVGFHGRERPRSYCRLSQRLDRADLFVDGDPSNAPLRYPLDQILCWGLLPRHGGLMLHAALAVKDGYGRIFAGRSGAGKSTLSALCAAQGWEILNDDRVILYPGNDGWLAAGTPWHGSGRFARNLSVPLRAIYLLRQDVTDTLAPLSVREARMELLQVTAVPWFEDDWSQGALRALENLTAAIPVKRFCFTRNVSAVNTMETETAA